MISINSLTVAYGGFTLLDNISFHVSENDKIGLTGKNGAGKSTILKLICGLQKPTSGKIEMPSDLRIGYLPQIMEHHKGKSVIEEAMTAFSGLFSLEKELDSLMEQLSLRTDYDSDEYRRLIERMNDVNDRLSYTRDVSPEVAAGKTLLGLGFRHLLLDEPTNHLDIESIEWLEDYLKAYKGSLVLISHDRKFLDNITNRTVEIMLGHIHDYKVPYSRYLELRKERLAQQRAAYENQQRMIEKTEEFIERFRYKPTKSNQVQSRIKQLDKLERIDVDVEDPRKTEAGRRSCSAAGISKSDAGKRWPW